MKALVYTALRKLEVKEVPDPDGSFILRVAGCAICGTDLKAYLHGHPYFKPPVILGHEFYGTVEKAPKETGYKKGDWVCVAPYGNCGKCPVCLRGAGEMCQNKKYVSTGAFCELIEVPPDFVDDGVVRLDGPDEAFALTEPLACVLCSIGKMDMGRIHSVLIIGGGPMGALNALTMGQMGIRTVVSEPNDYRRQCISGWGIEAVRPEDADYSAFDAIVVAVNKPELFEAAVKGVPDGGTVVMFAGMPSGTELRIDAKDIHYRGVTLTGSSGFATKDFKKAFSMIKADPDAYRRLITHRFSFSEGQEAFETLARGEAFKVLLKP
ncbi:MAG: zinc-dependent alcohol dehydrogenase [Oscillospiraceae bacterium]